MRQRIDATGRTWHNRGYGWQLGASPADRPHVSLRKPEHHVDVDRQLTERGDHDDIDQSAVQRYGED